MSTRQTIVQRRARRAMECVRQVKKNGGNAAREYGSLAQGAPASIQSSGLGQTLAFWRAKGWEDGRRKGDSGHADIYDHVSRWVCEQISGWKGEDLLSQLVAEGTTTNDYRRATAEAMAFLVWLKRFAEAELE